MGFKDKLKQAYEEGKASQNEKMKSKFDFGSIQEKKLEEKARLDQMDAEGIPYCPKCKSSSVQFLDRRKKLSIGRAVVGSVVGPAGTIIGAFTSKKHNGVMKCLKCGNEWKLK